MYVAIALKPDPKNTLWYWRRGEAIGYCDTRLGMIPYGGPPQRRVYSKKRLKHPRSLGLTTDEVSLIFSLKEILSGG